MRRRVVSCLIEEVGGVSRYERLVSRCKEIQREFD